MHVPRLDFGLSQQLCLHSWWVSQNLISCKKSAYSAEIIPCVDWQEWMSGGSKLVRVSTLPRSFTFHSIFSHFCVSQAELKITKDRQWWSYIIVLRAARRVKKDIAIKTNPKILTLQLSMVRLATLSEVQRIKNCHFQLQWHTLTHTFPWESH